ncbi:hypothetical protein FACS1894217_01360 [Clostridia bacterium]|nr:hypothetical protein FACS1894217_01360 [Clostridia bacterium]
MKKQTCKKIIAFAVIMAIIATSSIGAFAADYSGSWHITDVNLTGVPNSVDVKTDLDLYYSTKQTTFVCNQISHTSTTPGFYGTVTVTVSVPANPSSTVTLKSTATATVASPLSWTTNGIRYRYAVGTGVIPYVRYRFSGDTTYSGTFNAGGVASVS